MFPHFVFSTSSLPAASSSQDSVSLVLDAIKSAVRFQKVIAEAWLKVRLRDTQGYFFFLLCLDGGCVDCLSLIL